MSRKTLAQDKYHTECKIHVTHNKIVIDKIKLESEAQSQNA